MDGTRREGAISTTKFRSSLRTASPPGGFRLVLLGVLLAGGALGPVRAMGGEHAASGVFAAAKTGKERLSDKASDEQRVTDCKVPQARRTRPRPAACP